MDREEKKPFPAPGTEAFCFSSVQGAFITEETLRASHFRGDFIATNTQKTFLEHRVDSRGRSTRVGVQEGNYKKAI